MSTKSDYRGGVQTFYDPAKKYLITSRASRYQFHDDFDLYTTIPAAASRANGCPWVKDITGAAPPTVALAADAQGGALLCSLTSASQAQDATAHWDDNRHLDLDSGLIFQAYAKLTTLPTLLAIAHLGLMDDNGSSFLGTTYNVGFTIQAGGAIYCNMDDNATVTAVDTGVVAVVDTYNAFRIESFDKTNIKFFVDGVCVCQSTTFNYAGTAGANSTLQPSLGIDKASGAGVGVLHVNSVDFWQN